MQTHPNDNANSGEDESLLELESDFFRDLLGKLEDPVFVKNGQHQWIFVNQAFEELIGCNELVGKTDADLLPPEQVEKFYEGDRYVIRNQTSLTQEEEVGEGCYALVKKIPIRLPDKSIGLFGIIFDISDYRKVQLEVEKLRLAKVQSRTDPLTGLANRRHLEEHFEQLSNENSNSPYHVGLLHIDLDYFKEVNDTKGHLLGDAVLIQVAAILRECLGKDDFIARIGGDEFVAVICDKCQSELNDIAQKIINKATQPVTHDNETCAISLSIGVAIGNNENLTLNQMLKCADLALYRAKQNGRGRYEPFTAQIQQEHNEDRQQRDDFRVALDEKQFVPYYQPQFDTETLEIVGVEALARWSHPQRGLVLPSEFLMLAESEKRLVDLDRSILQHAALDAHFLNDSGCCLPMLSINISSQSLANDDLVDTVKQMMPFANNICFELVESMMLDEPESAVIATIEALRDLGISLDIDDFGSGHTSLLGMLETKPDRVKIDKRLVIPMVESSKHLELVSLIIKIARSFGMDTVAEGVESEAHRQLLRELGCTTIQGFGFAKPMPLDDLKELLQHRAAA